MSFSAHLKTNHYISAVMKSMLMDEKSMMEANNRLKSTQQLRVSYDW